MKIESKNGFINEIVLNHKGKKLRLKCFIKPFPCIDGLDLLEGSKSAEITFDDSQEIDSMIEMLIKFRKECREYIGEWKISKC